MPKLESKAATRIMLYAMLLAASYTLVRTVGDSLFLSRVGNDSLAIVFVASGIATAIIASIWFALTRRLSLAKSIRISGVFFVCVTLAAWCALPYLHHSWWLLAAIYLLTEVKGCVNTINVVSSMNGILGGHSSRAAWARIGLGAPLAGIIVGLLVGLEASFISLRTWLLLSAILDAVALLPLANAARLKVPRPENAQAKSDSLDNFVEQGLQKLRGYACSRQFRFWIGILIGTKVVVLTLFTFYWKVSVNNFFFGDESALTHYFAIFYAATGLLTLIIQVFLTSWLLSRDNLYVPILVMPIGLAIIGGASMLGTGALFFMIAFTLAKALEVWRRSVHETTLSLLYTRIQPTDRRPAIAINNAVVKPLAEVSASLVLLFGTAAIHKSVIMLAIGLWIIATISLLRLVSIARNRPENAQDETSATQKSKSLLRACFTTNKVAS